MSEETGIAIAFSASFLMVMGFIICNAFIKTKK